jgi:hypothetical protein
MNDIQLGDVDAVYMGDGCFLVMQPDECDEVHSVYITPQVRAEMDAFDQAKGA